MPQNPFNNKEFNKLKAKWNKKLSDSGFTDIEKDDGYFKVQEPAAFRGKSNGTTYLEKEVYYTSKQEYFRLAGHFYHDHTFDNDFEKQLWAYHMDGHSIREIVKIINKKRHKLKVNRCQIHAIIRKLAKLMLEVNHVSR